LWCPPRPPLFFQRRGGQGSVPKYLFVPDPHVPHSWETSRLGGLGFCLRFPLPPSFSSTNFPSHHFCQVPDEGFFPAGLEHFFCFLLLSGFEIIPSVMELGASFSHFFPKVLQESMPPRILAIPHPGLRTFVSRIPPTSPYQPRGRFGHHFPTARLWKVGFPLCI